VGGFKTFLLRGNLVDLAVGIVIGVAFGTVISALVKDIITPVIAALFGKPDFSGLHFTINNSRFLYGDFTNALIAFVIVAAVLYSTARERSLNTGNGCEEGAFVEHKCDLQAHRPHGCEVPRPGPAAPRDGQAGARPQ
jgi:large conductance mechanosensitive channel protein